MLRTSGFVDDVKFTRDGQTQATRIGRGASGRSLMPTFALFGCVRWKRVFIMLLSQATLKDVFESKPINETQLKLTTNAYVERISLIRQFTSLFQV